jgi:putative two-component system response regulator
MSASLTAFFSDVTSASILVVDDEEPVRRLLINVLKPAGYRLFEAGSAEEAETMLPGVAPDVVVLDINLPGRSGHQLLQLLRSDPATKLLPVIMLTGRPTWKDRLSAIDEGATDFLSKPFSPDELLVRVRSVVRMKRYTDALEDAENVIVALARTVDARDPYTQRHSERVALYGGLLATAVGLEGTDLAAVRRGGLFHDIGKIAVRDAVLLKPGRLTAEEFDEVKRHPAEGRRLLQGMRSLTYALDVVTYHHERLDGSGYPEGLRGKTIPLTARVITIADIYDALTTPRPYRPALSRDDALREMTDEVARGWWDQRLFQEFCALIENEPAS